jgi:hypothetical protein
MTSSGGGSGSSSGSTSSQASTSSLIGSMYNHYNHVVSTTNPTKVIKQFGLFKFEEDLDATPWHVSSPLNLAPTTTPLPKFKDHLPKFSGNGTISVNEHLIAFSNACHNIGENENDICMCLFVNSLEGKVATDFFELPPKFSLLGMNCLIGLSLHMDNPKVQQISSKNTIILFITRVKPSNLSICVSLNCIIKSQILSDLIIRPL